MVSGKALQNQQTPGRPIKTPRRREVDKQAHFGLSEEQAAKPVFNLTDAS